MVRLTLSRNSAAISATLGKEADGSQLRLSESSIASRFKVSPKIRTDATFDFCNRIPSKADVPNPALCERPLCANSGHSHSRTEPAA
jgi:hypothetical protein